MGDRICSTGKEQYSDAKGEYLAASGFVKLSVHAFNLGFQGALLHVAAMFTLLFRHLDNPVGGSRTYRLKTLKDLGRRNRSGVSNRDLEAAQLTGRRGYGIRRVLRICRRQSQGATLSNLLMHSADRSLASTIIH